MKNVFLLLVILSPATHAFSQLTLDAAYPPSPTSASSLSRVNFGLAGEKYVVWYQADKSIKVYSMDHVLEKEIDVPSFITSPFNNVSYVSDNLFDTDSAIEYMIRDPFDGLPMSHLYILNEDGSILFDRDSVKSIYADDPFLLSDFGSVFPTSGGTKLLLDRVTTGWEIYSLPGSLPCDECSNGVYSGNVVGINEVEDRSSVSNSFPNPTNNSTRINYQLPDGIKEGMIFLYDANGIEVKQFKVTNAFSFIIISARDLPSGTYYYSIQTSVGSSGGKKIVVIK